MISRRLKRVSLIGWLLTITGISLCAIPAKASAAPSLLKQAPIATRVPTPAMLCTYAYDGGNVAAYDPWLYIGPVAGGPPVLDTSQLNFLNTYECGASLEGEALRKVCGFFGCSYQLESSQWQAASASTTTVTVTQGCISGTNRYQTEAVYYQPQLGAPIRAIIAYSNGLEFTC